MIVNNQAPTEKLLLIQSFLIKHQEVGVQMTIAIIITMTVEREIFTDEMIMEIERGMIETKEGTNTDPRILQTFSPKKKPSRTLNL